MITVLLLFAVAQKAVITDRYGNPVPSEVPAGEVIYFSAAKSEKGEKCIPLWVVTPPERRVRAEKFEGGNLLVVPTGLNECLLTVTLVVAKGDNPAIETVTVKIIGRLPQPPPDPDVDPKPDPKPPIPTPAAGLRVVFIYETMNGLSRDQHNIVFSSTIAAYLNSKCVKSKDGHPEWRRWDKDIVLSKTESQTMKDLWEATKPKIAELPAVLIVNDKDGKIHPLPTSEAATLELLKKWGG